jgi:hypothetical protein
MEVKIYIVVDWLNPGKGQEIFLRSAVSKTVQWPTKLAIQYVPGAKRPQSEAQHSSPSRAEVKNGGDLPPLPIPTCALRSGNAR